EGPVIEIADRRDPALEHGAQREGSVGERLRRVVVRLDLARGLELAGRRAAVAVHGVAVVALLGADLDPVAAHRGADAGGTAAGHRGGDAGVTVAAVRRLSVADGRAAVAVHELAAVPQLGVGHEAVAAGAHAHAGGAGAGVAELRHAGGGAPVAAHGVAVVAL